MPRYYDVVTQDELKTIIQKTIDNTPDEYNFKRGEFEMDIGRVLDDLKSTNKGIIGKDLSKIDFSFENWSYGRNHVTASPKIMGFQTYGSLTFYGMWAGGDWEYPVFFIVYAYEGVARAYIPKDGNVYNPKTKSAFGNNDEEDNAFFGMTDDEWKDNDNTALDFDEDKILADIQNRLKEKV